MDEIDLSEFVDTTSRPCIVARSMDLLSEQDARTFQAALEANHLTATSLVKWLRKRDIAISDNVVRRHRISECCCND